MGIERTKKFLISLGMAVFIKEVATAPRPPSRTVILIDGDSG